MNEQNTFHARMQADAALEAQGRFAAQRPQINGEQPTVTVPGPLPAWGKWPDDFSTFGEPIDALPGMTTVGGE